MATKITIEVEPELYQQIKDRIPHGFLRPCVEAFLEELVEAAKDIKVPYLIACGGARIRVDQCD